VFWKGFQFLWSHLGDQGLGRPGWLLCRASKARKWSSLRIRSLLIIEQWMNWTTCLFRIRNQIYILSIMSTIHVYHCQIVRGRGLKFKSWCIRFMKKIKINYSLFLSHVFAFLVLWGLVRHKHKTMGQDDTLYR
jgi:hypothetical protein